MKGPFLPRGGGVVCSDLQGLGEKNQPNPAWKHGIIIIIGLNHRIKSVGVGGYASMGFPESGVKVRRDGTIYIPGRAGCDVFQPRFFPCPWGLASSISATRTGFAPW